jgi:hypothetical protein
LEVSLLLSECPKANLAHRKIFRFFQVRKTVDAAVADQFEREANKLRPYALFQGDAYAVMAVETATPYGPLAPVRIFLSSINLRMRVAQSGEPLGLSATRGAMDRSAFAIFSVSTGRHKLAMYSSYAQSTLVRWRLCAWQPGGGGTDASDRFLLCNPWLHLRTRQCYWPKSRPLKDGRANDSIHLV